MNDTLVKWGPLQDSGDRLINYADNDIRGQLNKIKSLRSRVTWEGADGEASLQGFDNFLDEMQKLADAIRKYGQFLGATAQEYQHTSGTIQNTFENQIYQRRA